MIADDYDDVRQLVRFKLEASGRCEIVGEAANGREAVNLVSLHRPDVIILDVVMPVMSGLEALPLIRRASPATRILVFTGFPERLVDWRDWDVDAVLDKAAAVTELVETVLDVVADPD